MNNFFGFWDSNNKVDTIQLTQITLWAKSILYFHPNANLVLYTKKNIIEEKTINIPNLKIYYEDNFENLLIGTPLETFKINNKLSKPELSDIIRLALLFKYGGTWLDIDDIVVRPFPQTNNILGSFLWENNKNIATYWGSTFNLVDGCIISDKYKKFGFHIQNDPMINWEKGNDFLLRWMKKISSCKSADWGQKIPTQLIKDDLNIIKKNNILLIPQHHLLLHPAFGNDKQFGYINKKGPIFPPYDLRISRKVNYDDMITIVEFWDIIKDTFQKHDYCCIKNSKNTGIKQCNEGKEKRWLVGHLCDIKNIDNILVELKNIN